MKLFYKNGEFRFEGTEIIIDYNDIRKTSEDVSCTIKESETE